MSSVVVATPWFPNTANAGTGSFVWDSARALARSGWRVGTLVTRPWAPGPLQRLTHDMIRGEIEKSDFPELSGLDVARTLSLPRGLGRRVLNIAADRSLARRIEAMARGLRADVIHAHTEGLAPAAVEAGKRLGRPVVVTVHGLNSDREYLEAAHQRSRLSGALAAADRVILVGEPLRSFFADYIGRDDHLRVVANGVRIPPSPAIDILPDNEHVRLISVSNLHEGKGIDVTLRALARLAADGVTGFSYEIVGDGYQRAELEDLCKHLGLSARVKFAGQIPLDRVQQRLAGADVFVLPSYREAFGIAYLEAMAAGLLTIGVDGQGPSHFISHGSTGLLVPPQDADALAHTLRLIAGREPSRWRAIAAAGAKKVRENHSWDVHARVLRGVLEEAIASSKICLATAS